MAQDMILTCESCRARYLVPAHELGVGGRRVRCARCGHEWQQEYVAAEESGPVSGTEDQDEKEKIVVAFEPGPEDREPEPETEPEPIPESIRPVTEKSEISVVGDVPMPGRRRESGRFEGYAAAFMVFVTIAVVLVLFRGQVVTLWPPSVRLFETIGLSPTLKGQGLVLDRFSALVETGDDGEPVLKVEGRIVNTGKVAIPVPPMAASLLKENGEIFDSWNIDPPGEPIAPDGSVGFHTSYPGASPDIREVSIRFRPAYY